MERTGARDGDRRSGSDEPSGGTRRRQPAAFVLVVIFLTLFAADVFIMLAIDRAFSWSIGGAEHLLNAAALSLVATPLLYFLAYRGLVRAMDRQRAIERDLQAAVEQARNEEARTSSILAAIDDGISIQDRDFRILYQNEAHRRFVGDRIGEFCFQAYEQRDHVCEGCGIRRCFEDGKAHRVVRSVPVEGRGTVYVEITSSPLRDRSGEIVAGIEVARDITEKKEQETRLALSERLAALGKMASGIAHEINNPLAAIAGCAEGLLNRIDLNRLDPEFFRNYLLIIQEEIFRCKNITSSMLSMVRQSTYETKSFDVNETVRKAVDVIGYQGRLGNVQVELSLAPEALAVSGSEGEVRQVVLAVLSNAIDAMEEMGAVRIASGRENGSCFVTIADEGPGIPPEQQGRIFDPFFTTKTCKGGTGLGLSIAARIMNNHGGSISVRSSVGAGAIFKLTWPTGLHPKDAGEPVAAAGGAASIPTV